MERRGLFTISDLQNSIEGQFFLSLFFFTGGYSEPMQMLSDIIAQMDALIR